MQIVKYSHKSSYRRQFQAIKIPLVQLPPHTKNILVRMYYNKKQISPLANTIMHNQITLKRGLFAESIRLEQRQRIKKQIRLRYHEQTLKEQEEESYNDEEFRNLKYECRKNNFQLRLVEQAIGYLFSKNIATGLCQQSNIKFIDEITDRLQYSNEQTAQKLLKLISNKLLQLLELQIAKSKKNQKGNLIVTHQLSQLYLIKYCFDGFLRLLEKYKCYHELWIPFSLLRNLELKRYSLINFQKYLINHIENFESQEITVISFTLENFIEDCPDQVHKFIWIIDTLLAKYNIRPFDCLKLLDSLIDLICEPHLEEKISIIVEETSLMENITSYLDKNLNERYKNNFDVAGKVGYFIARMYSANNYDLCEKVYMKNIMVLGLIRSWLPVAINVSVPMLQHTNGTLIHSNHKCTAYLIYALTNIVVSEAGFLQAILVKSDIYRALIYMYRLVPLSCREEIAIFLYNMTAVSEVGSLRIMLETKLPEILTQMLKESNTLILIKALGIINTVCRAIEEDSNSQSVVYAWLYTRRKFQIELENLGAIKLIESLVHSPQNEIVQIAISALELLN